VRAALERMDVDPVEIDASLYTKLLGVVLDGELGSLFSAGRTASAVADRQRPEEACRVLAATVGTAPRAAQRQSTTLPPRGGRAAQYDPDRDLLYSPRQKLVDQLWVSAS